MFCLAGLGLREEKGNNRWWLLIHLNVDGEPFIQGSFRVPHHVDTGGGAM